MKVNLACGSTYIKEWRNLDYSPEGSDVQRANLLARLPFDNSTAELVYSSHFLEHVPRSKALSFLRECHRITRPGGHIRLVLPDLEELCTSYLRYRAAGAHDKADFLVLEILDQCVRTVPGGELEKYYATLGTNQVARREEIDFVFSRTGHAIQISQPRSILKKAINSPGKIIWGIQHLYCRLVLGLLPPAFREQNVSLATTGERHAWLYDYFTLERLLIEAGYTDVRRMTATTSGVADFPFHPLDVTLDGVPRKGAESMYVEALRP